MTDLLRAAVDRCLSGDKEALGEIVEGLQDDLYRLSLRMLGSPADAEDACQEILVVVITHLASFRGESSVRTWVWKIAARYLLKARAASRDAAVNFEQLEAMVDAGATATPVPLSAWEVEQLSEEVRLGCTQAMLGALTPPQRMTYILADIFELESGEAARVLDVTPAAFRKQLERARALLAGFMERKCGLANPVAACRCLRQIPVVLASGLVERDKQVLARIRRRAIPERVIEAWKELSAIDRAARVHRERANELAPNKLAEEIRALLDSGRYRMLQH